MRKNRRHLYFFSLTELLLVVAILAVLMASIFPTINRAIMKSRTLQCINQFKQMGMATTQYREDWFDRLPSVSDYANGVGARPASIVANVVHEYMSLSYNQAMSAESGPNCCPAAPQPPPNAWSTYLYKYLEGSYTYWRQRGTSRFNAYAVVFKWKPATLADRPISRCVEPSAFPLIHETAWGALWMAPPNWGRNNRYIGASSWGHDTLSDAYGSQTFLYLDGRVSCETYDDHAADSRSGKINWTNSP